MDTPRVRLVQFLLCPQNENDKCIPSGGGNTIPLRPAGLELHIVFFPAEIFSIAKQFWQHTGTGISSRLAERCLSMLPDQISPPHSPAASTPRYPSKNKHYAVPRLRPSIDHSDFGSLPDPPDAHSDSLGNDQRTYVEERYGRNLPLSSAVSAKRAMRRRIARVLLHDDAADNSDGPVSGDTDAPIGPSLRGVPNVTEDDVYLFPCGMSAIWHTHQIIMAVRPSAKSVCFG
jgi:cystathionine gamma-synthase